MPFSVYYSNRVEELFQHLKRELFASGSSPFARRRIVVPSPPLKSWLMLQLARDLKVAAGLEISYPDESLRRLGFSTTFNTIELALTIEGHLRQVLREERRGVWLPLVTYLNQRERRLTSLSAQLAEIFQQYRRYGKEMVAAWEAGEEEGEWQAELWRELGLQIPSPKIALEPNCQLHLFSISHLSPLHLDYFAEAARHIPTQFYLLSPCQAFWSDIRTDRESRRLHAFWKAKGASQGELESLDEFLRDSHPILANFGRLGREMVQQLEERDVLTEERYLLPEGLFSKLGFAPLLYEVEEEKGEREISLLDALQADLLLMRTPTEEEKIEDDSIQVHVAGTLLRETEVVHNLLLHLIAKHAQDEEPLRPEEILVMAPDMMEYAPFIKMVFQGSPLDTHLMEAISPLDQPLFKGFLQLLKLSTSRWTIEDLLDLFRNPAFRKRHPLDDEALRTLERWLEKSGIVWGQSGAHRDALLKSRHCAIGMAEKTEAGTWELGLDRLLKCLVFEDEALSIDTTEAELLGTLVFLIRSLIKDLVTEEKTLLEWKAYLHSLYEAYFDDPQEEQLFAHFAIFNKAGVEKYPFTTILYHLEESFKRQRTSYRESHLNAVRFCPLLPMRTVPAKVVVLMGMHEGAFPRFDSSFSLNLLQRHPKADYCPTKTDFDRYLFLEAILSARRYLILTYQGYSAADQKSQAPSLLIQELMTYLSRSYGGIEERRHPFHAFDKSYFTTGASLLSYSKEHFSQALAYYHQRPSLPSSFSIKMATPSQNIRLDMRELASFAKNPLKTYLNKTLGIYLPGEKGRLGEEKFILSPLDLYQIRKRGIRGELSLKELPFGLYKEVALKTAQDAIKEVQDNLQKAGVHPNEIFTLELTDRVKRPTQVSQALWQMPPLKVVTSQGDTVTLVGKLEEVAPQGLIVLGKSEWEKAVQYTPHFLVYEVVSETLPWQRQLLFAQSGKAHPSLAGDPNKRLIHYLDYYLLALKNPSPLLPELVHPLLTDKKMETDSRELLFLTKGKIDREAIMAHWKPLAERLFADLKGWFR